MRIVISCRWVSTVANMSLSTGDGGEANATGRSALDLRLWEMEVVFAGLLFYQAHLSEVLS